MQKICVILFSLSCLALSHSKRFDYNYVSIFQNSQAILFERDLFETNKNTEALRKIKLELLRGNTQKAKVLLTQAKYNPHASNTIQKRYLAIAYFLDEQYRSSLDLLSDRSIKKKENLKNVCMLKTLNMLILNDNRVYDTWKKCKAINSNLERNNTVWLDSLVKAQRLLFNTQSLQFFRRSRLSGQSVESIKLYLKLALFFNSYKNVLKKIETLSFESLKDPEIREILGMMYYKDKQFKQSQKYFEGIETANTMNFKANMYLAQKKLELAYSQFKVALKKKNDSQNAILKLLPLSWLLKQYKDGLNYSSKIVSSKKSSNHKIYQAAFLTQLEKHQEAINLLREVENQTKGTQNWSANLLFSYNYLVLGMNDLAQSYSAKACEQEEGLSCLFQYHFSLWSDFSSSVLSKKTLNKQDLLTQYSKEKIDEPIVEKEYVSQKYLEELERRDKILAKNQKGSE